MNATVVLDFLVSQKNGNIFFYSNMDKFQDRNQKKSFCLIKEAILRGFEVIDRNDSFVFGCGLEIGDGIQSFKSIDMDSCHCYDVHNYYDYFGEEVMVYGGDGYDCFGCGFGNGEGSEEGSWIDEYHGSPWSGNWEWIHQTYYEGYSL